MEKEFNETTPMNDGKPFAKGIVPDVEETKLKQIKGILNDFELGHLTKDETIKSIINWQTRHAINMPKVVGIVDVLGDEEIVEHIKNQRKERLLSHLKKLNIHILNYKTLIVYIDDFENEVKDETLQKLYDNGFITDRQAFHSIGRYIKNK